MPEPIQSCDVAIVMGCEAESSIVLQMFAKLSRDGVGQDRLQQLIQ